MCTEYQEWEEIPLQFLIFKETCTFHTIQPTWRKIVKHERQDKDYVVDGDGAIRSVENLKQLKNVKWVVLSLGGNDPWLCRHRKDFQIDSHAGSAFHVPTSVNLVDSGALENTLGPTTWAVHAASGMFFSDFAPGEMQCN